MHMTRDYRPIPCAVLHVQLTVVFKIVFFFELELKEKGVKLIRLELVAVAALVPWPLWCRGGFGEITYFDAIISISTLLIISAIVLIIATTRSTIHLLLRVPCIFIVVIISIVWKIIV